MENSERWDKRIRGVIILFCLLNRRNNWKIKHLANQNCSFLALCKFLGSGGGAESDYKMYGSWGLLSTPCVASLAPVYRKDSAKVNYFLFVLSVSDLTLFHLFIFCIVLVPVLITVFYSAHSLAIAKIPISLILLITLYVIYEF